MYTCQQETPERHTRSEILEELIEIISKYNQTHAIIILGDMNVSLKPRKGNEQDVMRQKVCQQPQQQQQTKPLWIQAQAFVFSSPRVGLVFQQWISDPISVAQKHKFQCKIRVLRLNTKGPTN